MHERKLSISVFIRMQFIQYRPRLRDPQYTWPGSGQGRQCTTIPRFVHTNALRSRIQAKHGPNSLSLSESVQRQTDRFEASERCQAGRRMEERTLGVKREKGTRHTLKGNGIMTQQLCKCTHCTLHAGFVHAHNKLAPEFQFPWLASPRLCCIPSLFLLHRAQLAEASLILIPSLSLLLRLMACGV